VHVRVRAARKAGFWIRHRAAVARADISTGEGRIFKNDKSLESLEPIESIGTEERQYWQHCEPIGDRKASTSLKCEIRLLKLNFLTADFNVFHKSPPGL